MKIHILEIQNLASLKGKHVINFDHILEQSNLFAITGDTGSGKSTLLNAISLALYGQNYKTSINQTDYVTLGESEAKVSVTFSVGLLKYVANWTCRLKKSSGEFLKTPKILREFFIKNDDSLTPLTYNADSVLNLTFEQFSKTIILNQGQFAQFLTSSFKERKDIIEKLYQGDILEKLSPKLFSNIKEIKQQIALHESSVSSINLQNLESIEILKKKHHEILNKVNNFSEIYNFSTKLNNKFIEIEELKKNKSINTERLVEQKKLITEYTNKINLKKDSFEKENDNLLKLKKEFKQKFPILQDCIKKHNELKLYQKNIDTLKTNIFDSSKELEHTSEKINSLLTEIDSDKEALYNIRNLISFKIDENNFEEISTFLKEIKTKKQKHNEIIKQQRALKDTLSEFERDGHELSNKISNLEKDLSNKYIKDIDLEITHLEKEQQRVKNIINELNQIEKKRLQLFNTNNDNQKSIQLKKSQLLQITNKLKDREDKRILIENSIKLYELEQAINLCKAQSLEEHTCLVCNSTDLSLINIKESGSKSVVVTKLTSDIEQVNQEIKSLQQEFYALDLEKNHLQKTIYSNQNDYSSIVNNINLEISENLSTGLNNVLTNHLEEFEQIDKELIILLTTKKENESIESDIENLKKVIYGLRAQYSKISKQIQDFEHSISNSNVEMNSIFLQLSSILSSTIIFDNLEELEKSINNFQKLSSLNKVLSQKDKYFNELKYNRDLTKKQLTKLNKEVIDIEKVIHDIHIFIKKEVDDQNPQSILDELSGNIEFTTNKIDSLKEDLRNLDIDKAQADSKIKMTSEQLSQLEIQSTKAFHEIKEYSTSLCNLNNDLLNEEFAFLRQLSCLKNKVNIDFILNFKDKILTLNNKSLSELDNIKEQFSQIKLHIDNRKEIDKRLKETEEAIKKLNRIKERKENLFSLVGKDEFRNFVLSLVEKELILYTNKELEQLCNSRYEIVHFTKNKMSPDFYIIDKYKEGLIRKVSTLSGGETFMVSLAMALALAEMTRGQNEIDSFFIDEGFGTLDIESLENILDMLKRLHHRGKQIGIISHVKSLTDRIEMNIRLTKDMQGSSRIDFLSN